MDGSPVRFLPLGIDIFCMGKKFLVFNMVGRNLKIKYRRSLLGLFWTLLVPMAMAFVYYFVFKIILNVQIPNYLIFILSGIMPWLFFSQTIIEGMESIVGNFGLISKVPVPIQVFPYTGAITNLVTLCLSFPILFGAALFSGVEIGLPYFMVFYYTACLFLMAYGLSIVLGILFVYFRDIRHIMAIVMQLWFYSTPVIYHERMVPEHLYWLLYVNPVGMVFVGLHKTLLANQWPSSMEVGIAGAWTIGIVLLALIVQRSAGQRLVEHI